MKILIVDDEELTRAGLIASIDWKKLGIDEIYQADDGENGYREALKHRPDIVLCDIRMPRMGGIDMLKKIRELQPAVVAVFMSGYSDKEYLKSAIQLQAIDYIEKPIETKEMTDTLRRAIEQADRVKMQNFSDGAHGSEAGSRLAYLLTMPYQKNAEKIESLYQQIRAGAADSRQVYGSAFLVRLQQIPEDPSVIADIGQAMDGYLNQMHFHMIWTERRIYHYVFHVFGDHPMEADTGRLIARALSERFRPLSDNYVVMGSVRKGTENFFYSYEDAVALLQSSFFFEKNSVLTGETSGTGASSYGTSASGDYTPFVSTASGTLGPDFRELEELSGNFQRGIQEGQEKECADILKKISTACSGSLNLIPNQVRSLYYNMFLALDSARKQNQLIPDLAIEDQENILDIMEHCFSYQQLHAMLREKTDSYFSDVSKHTLENPTITRIRGYIADNYSDPSLSVKSISDHAGMSASYTCTFFKNETGSTLNQYITDYRMKKAKQLLADPRNKVADVSLEVGYNDGNYFAKTFRKIVGISPSEYRDQVTGS